MGSPRPSGSAALIATGVTPNRTTWSEPTSGPGFPRHGKARPIRSGRTLCLNHESPEFIRFVNPGDLRVAHLSCGTTSCHADQVLQVRKSMMTHGAMLWGAALFNNGSVPFKSARYGQSYSMNGSPQRMQTFPPPTQFEIEHKGVVPFLDPLPRFEASQPGNVLRIFERGRREPQEIGIPNPFEDPGKPRAGLSARGLGTRTAPIPSLSAFRRPGFLTRRSTSSAPTIILATIDRAVAPPAT